MSFVADLVGRAAVSGTLKDGASEDVGDAVIDRHVGERSYIVKVVFSAIRAERMQESAVIRDLDTIIIG